MHLMKRIGTGLALLWLGVGLTPAVLAQANPGASKAALGMFEAINAEEIFQQTIKTAIDKQVQGNPQFAQYRPRIEQAIADGMPWKKVKRDLVRFYVRDLTADDLTQMTAFYKTPAGLKLAQKTMDKSLAWDKVKSDPASLASMFTPDEMAQIATFVQTPTGAKLVVKGPVVSQNVERYLDKNVKRIVDAEARRVIAEMMSGKH